MGREVRLIKEGWEHPKKEDGGYIPLYDSSENALEDFESDSESDSEYRDSILSRYGTVENYINECYMPYWEDTELTHIVLYENTTEGTPMSPPFPIGSDEELAQWLEDSNVSSFGSRTATKEQWLCTIKGGYAPSAVI